MAVQDAVPEESLHQVFTVDTAPKKVLDQATRYLEAAGTVSPALEGRIDRFGDSLAVHHGRIETRINVVAAEQGSKVEVHRHGQAPLEDTRSWLLLLGLGGFIVAWFLTFYNESRGGLHPLVTMMLFLGGFVVSATVLFVADRSLERRSERLVLSLQDAVQGDPLLVLQREMDALERSSALANGLLFYVAGLLASFIIYAILFSPDVVTSIDEAVAFQTMRFVFLFPIVPSLIFAGIYFGAQNNLHAKRMATVTARQ